VVLSQRPETDFGDAEAADTWHRLQRNLLILSPESRQIIAAESGHYILLDQPELVIDAIKPLVLKPGWSEKNRVLAHSLARSYSVKLPRK
jgi:hypothetical protein